MEKYYRNPIEDFSGNLIFQTQSWTEGDFSSSEFDPSDGDIDDASDEYQILVHGVTEKGESVCARIMKFTPYFYLRVPSEDVYWESSHTKRLFGYLKYRLKERESEILPILIGKKVKLFPFTNRKKISFMKLSFTTMAAFKKCINMFRRPLKVTGIGELSYDLYESNLQPVVRFTHLRDIRMAGYVKIKKNDYTIESDISTAQIQVSVNWEQVHPYEIEDIAPFRILSWDIECQSSLGFPEFPKPERKGDYISQIGCTLWIFGQEKIQFVLTCVQSDPLDDVLVINCKNEKELLFQFCQLVNRLDPDILTGYNTWGFDDSYTWIRMCRHDSPISLLSRVPAMETNLTEKNLTSGAYGYNDFKILDIPGRETFDLLVAVRREHKLESYKLGRVGLHFTGEDKEDMPYKELFRILKDKDPVEVAKVCSYCAQDTFLVIQLLEKLCIIPNFIEMAKSTRVPINWLLLRGQQCKVFSQIVYEARKLGFLVPVFGYVNGDNENKFKGATVLKAMRGAYFEPVSGLDFKSLYPSIMIAFNMCYSTLVTDEKYMNIEGVEYETVSWTEDDGVKHSFTFVQNIRGVLPDILEKLWSERNATKKEMKKCRGTFKAQVLNGKQLAIKVTMNSVYGFTGAHKGMLPCKAIAASVTAKGREMIAHTSRMAEEMYSCVTTYGDTDSCYVQFNVDKTKFPGDAYMEEHFRLATECAKKVTETFKPPIELEFEKVMCPFLLFAKKRYAYLEWTNPKKPDHLDYKGIQVVRRDNCQYVKDTSIDILNAIMYDRDVPKAQRIAEESVRKLLNDEVDRSKLTISKSLRNEYKVNGVPTKWDIGNISLPHVKLAQSLIKLDPMGHPKPPDRVPFLYIQIKKKNALQWERVAHPDYMGKNKIDSLYYFQRQLQSPIEMLFELLIDDPTVIYREEERKRINKDAGVQELTNFFGTISKEN